MTSTHVPPPFHGIFTVAPTPLCASGDADFQSQGRVLDCMVDLAADGVCILASSLGPCSLTEGERNSAADLAAGATGTRYSDPMVLRWRR